MRQKHRHKYTVEKIQRDHAGGMNRAVIKRCIECGKQICVWYGFDGQYQMTTKWKEVMNNA